jgi:predicted nucleic acid-binding protein
VIVLDANVLIALLDPSDAHHDAADELMVTHAGRGLSVSPVTLAEFLVGPTLAGPPAVKHAEATMSALDVQQVPLDAESPLALARMRVETRLPMPDCCVLLAAQQVDGAVASFDTRLNSAARALGIQLA